MDMIFLGTGGAWGVPELKCDCLICREMRRKGEKRERSALLFSHKSNLLIDCGPDIRAQLSRNKVGRIDGVLISHEHGDHYIGMDDLLAYKRNCPRDRFLPIPVYMTAESWEVIRSSFAYLEQLGLIMTRIIEPGKWLIHEEFEILPFKTDHGSFAKGSVGFLVRFKDRFNKPVHLIYTSDFVNIPQLPSELIHPHYLIIQSFWLNEPVHNRPSHMSFQRALDFIDRFKPLRETFLVHIGDADMVEVDPANNNAKKYEPKDPLRPPSGGDPYPIPLSQAEWQKTVDLILSDRALPYKVTVAYDDLCFRI
ncbi:MAG: MBL fold metallo-hydrolase [Pseudomonadota bacterium]